MINKLNLKGTELLVYAIIYKCSQDGKTEYTNSVKHLCDLTGASRSTIMTSLSFLTKESLIIKKSETIDGMLNIKYKTNFEKITR